MQTLMSPGPLLDDRGHLVETGWAPSEIRKYRRSAITAPKFRIKEWDYYCVLTADYGIALTVADNGYMGLLGVSWLDFRTPHEITENVMLPFPMGRLGLPESADDGDVVVSKGKARFEFRHVDGGRHLIVDYPAFDGGRGLHADLILASPADDRMVIATPFPKASRSFYYNQKINCLPSAGTVRIGSDDFTFRSEDSFGVLDWGRGVWTYDNTWYWGSASGLVNGERFGFNIGYGFGDTRAASENIVFVGGRAHKLDRIDFDIPQGTYDGAPWNFSSNDGRFGMTFEPIIDRAATFDVGVLRSIQHQVFGKFSGTVILDDGTSVVVRISSDLPRRFGTAGKAYVSAKAPEHSTSTEAWRCLGAHVFSCRGSRRGGWAVPADRLLIRVDRHRRIEHRFSVGANLDPPFGVVHRPMMVTAQQDQVVEICWATIVPVNNMVGIAPPRRRPAPRKRTPTIPNRQRPPLWNGRRSRFLTAVERNTILIQEDPGDGAVARQHPGSVDADRAHPIRPREPQLLSGRQQVFQNFKVRHVFRGRGDRDVWFHSAFDRTQPRSLVPAQQLAKPVRPS